MKKVILGILVSTLVVISGFSIATVAATQNEPPYEPSDPHPADGATDIGIRTRLRWTGGDPDLGDKAVYHLHFGTDPNPGLIAEDLIKPNYRPGGLEELTQYYWYVVAEDKSGATTTGPLWTFTTIDCLQINLVALQEQETEQPEAPSRGSLLGLLERIKNRILDTLGIFNGDCNELVEISGILTYDGTYFYVDEVEVHFGPVWYISRTQSNIDYDDDGELELIIDELHGLVGTFVTMEGYMQSDNWFSVFTINGETYRDIGKPIWSGGAGGHHGGK